MRAKFADVIVRGLLICAIWAVLTGPTSARDDGRYANSELKPWFDQLRSKFGLCCSEADATFLADDDVEAKGGSYRVRIGESWIDVPPDAILAEPNKAGRAIVWLYSGGLKVRCFIPGTLV